ncbi:MAG: hypothetical protein ABIR06_13030 [Cyclobacteriaceae bacterium]
MKRRLVISILLNLVWLLSACAPLFSDMHSARLVGKKQFEITPGYSSVGAPQPEMKAGISNYLGIQAAYGLSDNVELRFRFEHSWLKKTFADEVDKSNFNVIGIGPKISLVKDRLAVFLPIGLAAGSLVEFQPTILGTIPILRNKIDFNPSVKHLLDLCDVCWQPLIAFNLGVGISSDITRWAIRPEYGLLYNLGQKGHFKSFSIGLSMNMSALSRPK